MNDKEFDIDKILEEELAGITDESTDEEEMEDDVEEDEEDIEDTDEDDADEEEEEEESEDEDEDEEEDEPDEDESEDEDEEEEKPKPKPKKKNKKDKEQNFKALRQKLKEQKEKAKSSETESEFEAEFGISLSDLKEKLRKDKAKKSGMDAEAYEELMELRAMKKEARARLSKDSLDKTLAVAQDLGATDKQVQRALDQAKASGIDLIKNPNEELFKTFLIGNSPSLKRAAAPKKLIIPKGKKTAKNKTNTIDKLADSMADDIMKQFGIK